ncbi:MAG: glycerol-3-phosphate dehydrogenase [Gammaproteobacteria bacterium]|nr:glycerol-3-phosphate dehydrogenase [Gammaproteobacteria bacterium]
MQLPSDEVFDILVIGGGINGTGIARDAAGRGFSVCLCEANGLGSGTSSASSKLIHGGLRYLEHYEFRLVREALKEREILLSMAPHIIKPMRFVLPHSKSMRPAWLLRLGLFLYDHLGGLKYLQKSRRINLNHDDAGAPLKPAFHWGFEYSDCWVDDTRLVLLNAIDANDRGATLFTHTKVESARCEEGIWEIKSRNRITDEIVTQKARVIVNAAGPWVDQVLGEAFGLKNPKNVRLVRGSHIIVEQLFEHGKPYIFQNADERIIFAIPYLNDYTVIGTTDADQTRMTDSPKMSDDELQYLCDAANEYFTKQITRDDVIWSYAGVRSLYNDGSGEAKKVTRDYVLKNDETSGAPLINVFGGKITTYRRLAESVVERIEKILGRRGEAWTSTSSLPGGNFAVGDLSLIINDLKNNFPFVNDSIITRLSTSYGTKAAKVLENAKSAGDLGEHFGGGLYQKEVEYLVQNEWAINAEDILFRCTRIGVGKSNEISEKVESFLATMFAENTR